MNETTRHMLRGLAACAIALCLPVFLAADDTASLRAEIERQKAQLDQEMARLQERMDSLQELEQRVSALETAQPAVAGSEGAGPRPAPGRNPAVPALAAPAPATGGPDEPPAAIGNLRDYDRPLTGQDLVDDDFPKS